MLMVVRFTVLFAFLSGLSAGIRADAQTPIGAPPRAFDVRAYGAKGDSTTLETDAINRAIDAAASAGGGTVYFPAGATWSRSYMIERAGADCDDMG